MFKSLKDINCSLNFKQNIEKKQPFFRKKTAHKHFAKLKKRQL